VAVVAAWQASIDQLQIENKSPISRIAPMDCPWAAHRRGQRRRGGGFLRWVIESDAACGWAVGQTETDAAADADAAKESVKTNLKYSLVKFKSFSNLITGK